MWIKCTNSCTTTYSPIRGGAIINRQFNEIVAFADALPHRDRCPRTTRRDGVTPMRGAHRSRHSWKYGRAARRYHCSTCARIGSLAWTATTFLDTGRAPARASTIVTDPSSSGIRSPTRTSGATCVRSRRSAASIQLRCASMHRRISDTGARTGAVT